MARSNNSKDAGERPGDSAEEEGDLEQPLLASQKAESQKAEPRKAEPRKAKRSKKAVETPPKAETKVGRGWGVSGIEASHFLLS